MAISNCLFSPSSENPTQLLIADTVSIHKKMNLSKVYFIIIAVIYLMFCVLITGFTEDLKNREYFNRYIKVTLPIGFLGILMVFLNSNYICNWNCLLIAFSPLLTVLICKMIVEFYRRIIKWEGFQVQWGELSDGIWKKNNGNVESGFFYFWYTFNLTCFPIIIFIALFFLIEKHIC